MSIISSIVSHINIHSMASAELGLVSAGFAKLVVGLAFLTSGYVGVGVAVAGYLLAIFDPTLVSNLEADVKADLAALKAKVASLEGKVVTTVATAPVGVLTGTVGTVTTAIGETVAGVAKAI